MAPMFEYMVALVEQMFNLDVDPGKLKELTMNLFVLLYKYNK